MSLTVGSICTGYGGLDQAVCAALHAEVAWTSDISTGACKLAAHRWPDTTNLGDITQVSWHTVPTVDIICGGTPCQDVSTAGRGAGMTAGTRSNLWQSMREAIHVIKPSIVAWENVPGARSARADSNLEPEPGRVGDPDGQPVLRALGRVLGDLASLGFNAEWRSIRASDIGAFRRRERVFVLAWHPDRLTGARGWPPLSASHEHRLARGYLDAQILDLIPTVRASDGRHGGPNQRGSKGDLTISSAVQHLDLLNTPRASRGASTTENFSAITSQWGRYADAIARQEKAFGIPAPDPTEPGRNGTPRLSARFTEWMQGLPAGLICDVPGITRTEAIELAGNGVIPQQAQAAIADMLPAITEEATA